MFEAMIAAAAIRTSACSTASRWLASRVVSATTSELAVVYVPCPGQREGHNARYEHHMHPTFTTRTYKRPKQSLWKCCWYVPGMRYPTGMLLGKILFALSSCVGLILRMGKARQGCLLCCVLNFEQPLYYTMGCRVRTRRGY